MILYPKDIFYLQSRDGDSTTTDNPATPIAFVIDGEVVYAHGFSPPIGEGIFLSNPTYSSRIELIDGEEKEVVIADVEGTITEMLLDELFTSVLLSEHLAIRITRDRTLYVDVGWMHDENGFYTFQLVDGIEKRLNGMLEIVE